MWKILRKLGFLFTKLPLDQKNKIKCVCFSLLLLATHFFLFLNLAIWTHLTWQKLQKKTNKKIKKSGCVALVSGGWLAATEWCSDLEVKPGLTWGYTSSVRLPAAGNGKLCHFFPHGSRAASDQTSACPQHTHNTPVCLTASVCGSAEAREASISLSGIHHPLQSSENTFPPKVYLN